MFAESWVGAAIQKLRVEVAAYEQDDRYGELAHRTALTADLLDEIFMLWHRDVAVPIGILEAAEALAENIMGVLHDA